MVSDAGFAWVAEFEAERNAALLLAGSPLKTQVALPHLLRAGLERDARAAAIISVRDQISWHDLEWQSSRLAASYLEMGLKPGDRIASLMPNRPALMLHYIACLKSGLVATPLNYRYMPPEIDHALGLSGAKMILFHAEREGDLESTDLAAKVGGGLIRYGAADFGASGDHRSLQVVSEFEDLLTREGTLAPQQLDGNDPQIIYFTSGSTGKPKGVTHSRSSYSVLLASMVQSLQIQAADRVMPASSFSHIGGSAFGLATLAAGGQLLMPRTGDAVDVHPLMKSHHPTVMWMLPSALINLVRDHDAERDEFGSVRLCLSGGDKVSSQLEDEFKACTGIEIDEGYGMTEIGCATLNPIDGENRIGSVGQVGVGCEAEVRDDQGCDVAAGETGRLWVRSPSNMVGYWNNEEATRETIVDGWLDTGDMMSVDQDGYLWFRGRKKQIIVHDGSNICPQEVEEALAEHPSVRHAGVVGIHDLIHGENVRAYVSLRPDAPALAESDLIEFARARIGYKSPEQIVFLDALPFNATGKVDRVELKQRAEKQLHDAGR